MPILNPMAIDSVLKESGLKKVAKTSKEELSNLLEDFNLTPKDVLENLSDVMRGADSSSVRLGAIKVAAELNDMLVNGDNRMSPVVNIIINDSEHSSVNPILVPREI